jgi:preprotein translocase subunit SecA
MLSENVYQDLFLRAGEYLLDEQLISKKNVKIRIFQQLRTTFCSLFRILESKKKKKKLSRTNYIVKSDFNDLRCAESNLYQFGFLKVHVRQLYFQLLTSIGQNILRMSYIRETINWRAYGQQNPLIEYNMEAFKSFKLMFEQIRSSMIYYFLNDSIN